MKSGYIHICFIIDESGSMMASEKDVVEGFKKVIQEQKKLDIGQCSVSLFKFNHAVSEVYVGRPVENVEPLVSYSTERRLSGLLRPSEYTDKDAVYFPCGGTAMNDGIGIAIDRIGEWLSATPEDDRPEQNLIVIMTDGQENFSKRYSLSEVKEKIKHQTDKYSWKFMYIGTDITDTKDADNLGIKMSSYSTRSNYIKNYDNISAATSLYRGMGGSVGLAAKCAVFEKALNSGNDAITLETETTLGIKIKKDTP